MQEIIDKLFPSNPARGVAKEDPNTRVFVGNGGNLIMVPGCVAVDSVRVGDQSLPAFLEEQYPMDGSEHPKMETVRLPLYQLIQTEDGAALQRSIKTNDGIWQGGVPVYVSGQWGGEVAAPAEAPLPDFPNADSAEELGKALNRLNSDVCRRFAFERGLGEFESKKPAIEALVKAAFPATE